MSVSRTSKILQNAHHKEEEAQQQTQAETKVNVKYHHRKRVKCRSSRIILTRTKTWKRMAKGMEV